MSAFEGMEEIVAEFIVESRELLERAESHLIDMERARNRGLESPRATLDAVFRAFHTIKGTAGFLGFVHVVEVAHVSENLLDMLRSGSASISDSHVTVLVDAVDFLRVALELIGAESSEAALAAKAEVLVLSIGAVARSPSGPPTEDAKVSGLAAPPPEVATPTAPQVESEPEPSLVAVGSMTLDSPLAMAPDLEPISPPPEPSPNFVSAVDVVREAAPTPPAEEPAPGGRSEDKPRDEGSRKTIRVDVEKLDALINLVGELILAENMVTHDEVVASLKVDHFQKALLQLNRVTRGLHDIVMAVRMVPIEGLFRKMHRIVRDVSLRLGKEVELVVSGEGTEIDKNLIEHIGDPLLHIMRNALDHGIESPETRVAQGKSPTGTIRLDARHNGGEVWITVADDGRGLDRERILDKAIERGLVDPQEAASLPDSRVYQLVFQPGFSTAEVVTEVSGRGVGMDVVWRNLQQLKGKVDIMSAPGEGAAFTLRIPLTLAIIEGMLVEVSGARYIIPLLSIRELVKVQPGMIHRLPDGREVAMPRGKFIGLVRLAELHGLQGRDEDDGMLVVVEHDGAQMAILVDELLGQRQTVIKPLPEYLGELPGISGCSILSNGDISLIIELADLCRGAGGGPRHRLSRAA